LNANVLSDKVLEAIPYDDWMLASEIALNLGERSIDVAWIISNKLLNKYVERKPLRNKQASPYIYRRRKRVGLR